MSNASWIRQNTWGSLYTFVGIVPLILTRQNPAQFSHDRLFTSKRGCRVEYPALHTRFPLATCSSRSFTVKIKQKTLKIPSGSVILLPYFHFKKTSKKPEWFSYNNSLHPLNLFPSVVSLGLVHWVLKLLLHQGQIYGVVASYRNSSSYLLKGEPW